jgi:alkylhydroperoxidase family enzyme
VAWIEQVRPEDATGELAGIYDAAVGRAGEVAGIIRVMSQRPSLLSTFLRFYVQLMKGRTSLTSREKELIATITSRENACFY